jgi:hypothetical protein
LRGVPAEHKDEQGHERWRLATIIDALSTNRGANTAAADEILSAGEAVEDLLSRLRAATDVEAARAILRAEGHRIGALDRALERGLIGLRPAEAQLLKVVRDTIIGAAIGETMECCRWQLADGK